MCDISDMCSYVCGVCLCVNMSPPERSVEADRRLLEESIICPGSESENAVICPICQKYALCLFVIFVVGYLAVF